MANGQFMVADIAGSLDRGRQFRQQQELRPLEIAAAQQALAGQKQQQQQSSQFSALQNKELEQKIDQRTDEQKNQSLYSAAMKIQSASDEEIIPILEAQIAKVRSLGGNPDTSLKGLEMAKNGMFDKVRESANNIIDIGVRQGDLKPQGGEKIKPTASQQDFQTFKELNEKARKTQDPIDIQLAKQFGVQSGFDRLTPQELADIDVKKESKKALVRQAATASKEAFDNLKKVRATVANIDDAIKALDKGAATGPIISKLPNFREASIELNNIKGRMGLDVVGATTFGALSESELAFALDTALPDTLEPKALKDWLIRKRDAQTKLSDELRKAASFLGKPGNTIADYIEQQEKENQQGGLTEAEQLELQQLRAELGQ